MKLGLERVASLTPEQREARIEGQDNPLRIGRPHHLLRTIISLLVMEAVRIDMRQHAHVRYADIRDKVRSEVSAIGIKDALEWGVLHNALEPVRDGDHEAVNTGERFSEYTDELRGLVFAALSPVKERGVA